MNNSLPTSEKITMAASDISRAGRGIYARQDIAAGEVIEVCPMLAEGGRFLAWLLRFTPLRNYFFQWGPERREAAFALGYGSLYNHTYNPNAAYKKNLEDQTIVFTARRDIKQGEEITINYNGVADDKRELWDDSINHPQESGSTK